MPAAAKGPWSALGPRPLPRLTSVLSHANLAAAGGALAKQVAAKRCKNGAESICRSLCWIWSTGGCTLFAPLLGGGGAGCAHPSSTPAQDPSVCEGLSLLRDQQPVLPSHVQPSLCPHLAVSKSVHFFFVGTVGCDKRRALQTSLLGKHRPPTDCTSLEERRSSSDTPMCKDRKKRAPAASPVVHASICLPAIFPASPPAAAPTWRPGPYRGLAGPAAAPRTSLYPHSLVERERSAESRAAEDSPNLCAR